MNNKKEGYSRITDSVIIFYRNESKQLNTAKILYNLSLAPNNETKYYPNIAVPDLSAKKVKINHWHSHLKVEYLKFGTCYFNKM